MIIKIEIYWKAKKNKNVIYLKIKFYKINF